MCSYSTPLETDKVYICTFLDDDGYQETVVFASTENEAIERARAFLAEVKPDAKVLECRPE